MSVARNKTTNEIRNKQFGGITSFAQQKTLIYKIICVKLASRGKTSDIDKMLEFYSAVGKFPLHTFCKMGNTV